MKNFTIRNQNFRKFYPQKFIDIKFGGIIDIGAHKGDKTKIFLKFFPNDYYYLFEPYNNYYQILKKNLKITKILKLLKRCFGKNSQKIFYTSQMKCMLKVLV